MRSIIAMALLAVVAATPLAAQEAEKAAPAAVTVIQAVVAPAIEDREPVGEAEAFPADVGTLYFYTVIEGEFAEAAIQHVWLLDGKEVARVPLVVRGPRWRTWSSKRVPPDWTGQWTARVVTGDDQELGSVTFTVGN